MHTQVLESLSGHFCQVATVTETDINATLDDYNVCEVRQVYAAADGVCLTEPMTGSKTYPKHEYINFAAHDDSADYCFQSCGPLTDLIKQTYRDLNNTLNERCNLV